MNSAITEGPKGLTPAGGHRARSSRRRRSKSAIERSATKPPPYIVGDIWDNLIGHREPLGAAPCSFTALDKVRIEAALLFYGYNLTDEHFPTEVGLGFTISKDKGDYRGKTASLAAAGHERYKAAGIEVSQSDMIAGGEVLQLDGKDAGVANSPCWSHRLNKSLALTHPHPSACKPGTKLKVIGENSNYDATVSGLPFYDPQKTKVKS